jgi:hypothetical protein
VTDNITLRRAAEQAREALTDWVRVYQDEKDMAALAALDAALAEPDAKPEPATDGAISEKFYNAGSDRYYRHADYKLGWRAAERFHGIRGSKT